MKGLEHFKSEVKLSPPRVIQGRVKQVRFGKLAFLQLNGAIFLPQVCRFSAISHYVFSKLGLRRKNRAHLRVCKDIDMVDRSNLPKTLAFFVLKILGNEN